MANTVSGGSGPTPSTSFSAPGVYPVMLTVTDDGGKTGSVTHNVYVSGPGEKSSKPFTLPCPKNGPRGEREIVEFYVDIYIPSYAENPKLITTFPTICPGSIQSTPVVSFIGGNSEGKIDEWNRPKNTIHITIELVSESESVEEGTVPAATVGWE